MASSSPDSLSLSGPKGDHTVTEEHTLGPLPQFSRDVSLLSRPEGGGDPFETPGVLTPFSGLLDIRAERGRAPFLDLSYLSLASLIVPRLARTDSGHRQPPATDTGRLENHSVEPTAGSTPGGDEGGEPTVRELIRADSDARPDRYSTEPLSGHERTGQQTTRDLDTRPGQSLGAGQHPRDQSERVSTQSELFRDESELAGETPHRTLADVSRRPDATTSNERADSPRPDLADSSSTGDGPERTVVSGPDPSRDRRTDSPTGDSAPGHPSTDPSQSGDSSGIPSPRMVAEGTGDDGRHRSSTPSSREPAPSDSTASAIDPTAQPGPRMVVDRGESTDDGDGGSGHERAASGQAGDGASRRGFTGNDRASGAHGVGEDGSLASVVGASTDPESQLIDRLYRTLRERHDIETRRRGGR